jgi:U4/U6.U5 tri-snRNP component SNU23
MSGFRRTWDKEYYAQKARDRIDKGDDFVDEPKEENKARRALREEFTAAEEGAAGPIGSNRAFLKSREKALGLEGKAGKIEIINPTDAEGAKAGFWCEVCTCLLKDSASYLSHINGKTRK